MHERARTADDAGAGDDVDHSRNKRTVVGFPFGVKSGVKHLIHSPSSLVGSRGAAAAGAEASEQDSLASQLPRSLQSHLLQLPVFTGEESESGSERRSTAELLVTHVDGRFTVREDESSGARAAAAAATSVAHEENVATLDQLMDDSLSLDCLTTPGVLIVVVLLSSSLLAVVTMSVCLSIRVRELSRQLKIRQQQSSLSSSSLPLPLQQQQESRHRRLPESFSVVKTSPFAFAHSASSSSSASSSPTSCLFEQDNMLPLQTSSSDQ